MAKLSTATIPVRRGPIFPYVKALVFSLGVKLALRPHTLLDVGCAKGEFLRLASFFGIDSFGVDVDEAAILEVPEHLRKKCFVGDIVDLPFETGQFNLVTSFAVLEHIPAGKSKAALEELLRVSRKNVLLQICVKDSFLERNRHYLLDPTHVNVKEGSWWANLFSQMGVNYRELGPHLGVFLLTV